MDLNELGGTAATRHPWETVRAEFFTSVVTDHAGVTEPLRVLDVGSGDAWFAEQLAGRSGVGTSISCWDINYTDDQLASPTSDAVTLCRDKPSGPFDVVLMMDVVEHVEDDRGLVTDVACDVVPGGILLVSVPAFQCLYSEHDRWLGHHRRYRPSQLQAVAPKGFEIVERGPLFMSLVALRAAEVAVERFRTQAHDEEGIGAWSGGATVTRAVEAGLRADARLGRWLGDRTGFAGGLSTWFVARRG